MIATTPDTKAADSDRVVGRSAWPLAWRHLGTVLSAADMSYDDLVSLRFFLASAADDPANVALIKEHLGDHRCCRTVVVQQLLEPEWLVEIEAVAAKVG